jgi:hypothetical protein
MLPVGTQNFLILTAIDVIVHPVVDIKDCHSQNSEAENAIC